MAQLAGTAQLEIVRLDHAHAGELLTLQRAAYVTEAQRYGDPMLVPLVQTLDEVDAELRSRDVIALGALAGTRIVGAVRLRLDGQLAHLGRLVVAPDQQGHGIGTALLDASELVLPAQVTAIELFTGSQSLATIRLYERHGYRRYAEEPAGTHTLVHLRKILTDAG